MGRDGMGRYWTGGEKMGREGLVNNGISKGTRRTRTRAGQLELRNVFRKRTSTRTSVERARVGTRVEQTPQTSWTCHWRREGVWIALQVAARAPPHRTHGPEGAVCVGAGFSSRVSSSAVKCDEKQCSRGEEQRALRAEPTACPEGRLH